MYDTVKSHPDFVRNLDNPVILRKNSGMDSISALLDTLNDTDVRTRALLEDLTSEQLSVPYHRGINPPIWELGHAAFFYDYFLLRHRDDQSARMPGYDEIWDSLENYHRDRWLEGHVPDYQTTLDYYSGVLDDVRSLLLRGDPSSRQRYICAYSIHHQNMHVESVIQARQTLAYPKPSFSQPWKGASSSENRGDVRIPAGGYPIGLPVVPPSLNGFCFDNEKPGFQVDLEEFSISKTLVSCGEFLKFVEAGGYENKGLWSFGGQHWLRGNERRIPEYWRKQDGIWQVRSFDVWEELNPRHPMLHVSYWEAEAFCQWADRRLPTEYEWEAAARGKEGRRYPWGAVMDATRLSMDGETLGRLPVDAFPEGATPNGCLQMLGTAWQWTTTPYLPYDGFSVDMYPYMSTLQFGSHKTTRGGSWATSASLIRNTYRQAYLPSRSDAFTGFRTCAC